MFAIISCELYLRELGQAAVVVGRTILPLLLLLAA